MYYLLLANFSDAVKPKPATTIYIMLSNSSGDTAFPKKVLAMKAIEHNMKAENVTTLLELQEPSWLSFNKLFRKSIIIQVVVLEVAQVFRHSLL